MKMFFLTNFVTLSLCVMLFCLRPYFPNHLFFYYFLLFAVGLATLTLGEKGARLWRFSVVNLIVLIFQNVGVAYLLHNALV